MSKYMHVSRTSAFVHINARVASTCKFVDLYQILLASTDMYMPGVDTDKYMHVSRTSAFVHASHVSLSTFTSLYHMQANTFRSHRYTYMST